MQRIGLLLTLTLVFALGPSPERLAQLEPRVDTAEARVKGRAGGFRGGHRARPTGARNRAAARPRPALARPSRPTSRPSSRPSRPWTKPVRPDGDRPGVGRPSRPGGSGGRPPGTRPPGERPPGGRPPGNRPRPPIAELPPGWRPPGQRPRPPIAGRPPVWRPPHWRPPHWRPPNWRPPYARPPYVRPPHWRWGEYYWYPRWGYYFTAAVAGATLVYVATLPEEQNCTPVQGGDETLYVCNGVLYRAIYHEGERVYEIVSDQDESVDLSASASPPIGLEVPVGPRLASPYMRGPDISEIQRALDEFGYDTGGADGVFGRSTDKAVRAFQSNSGLPATGIVDTETLEALGLA